MGGYGSSRWNNTRLRPVAEASLPWPISQLVTAIPKEDGAVHVVGLWGKQSALAHIARRGATVTATLSYARNGVPVRDPLTLVRGRSNLPGCQAGPWFWLCPCGHRAKVLFLVGGWWRCRCCSGITYTSSNASDKRVSAMLKGEYWSVLPDTLDGLPSGVLISLYALHSKVVALEQKRYERSVKRYARSVKRTKPRKRA